MRSASTCLLSLALLVAGCTVAEPSATPSPTEAATPSPTPTAPDLGARPLVWFAPLPPMAVREGRPYVGSEDFMDLFAADAAWELAASRVHVFKLYGEWVDTASAADLATAVANIRERGMVLAVEAGPLDADGCGEGVEGFAGSDSGRRLAQRIRAAGGTLQVIALDEPWFFAHVYDGPNACHWPVERIAQGVAEFIAAVREEFPWVVVGDIEPTPTPVSAPGLAEWMDAYAAAVGEPMAFLHLDPDWSRPDWSSLALGVEADGRARGVAVGMLYNGGGAADDAQWLHLAGQHILDHQQRDGGNPDHLVFQSWNDKPDFVLPETDENTFTALLNRYFDDFDALGLGGAGGNLAWRKAVTASSELVDGPATNLVDGDPDTSWNSGGGPVAWVEIDLGAVAALGEIRLTVAQYPAGNTEHRVFGRAATGDAWLPLGVLSGETADFQVLSLPAGSGWVPVRYLRIESVASPSWVAWREIEVFGE